MKKTCFLDLLKSVDEFVIPAIQRDYAQGRETGSDKGLCEEVRSGMIKALYDALVDNKELLLDYVYGANDKKIFYPIDGQQRLTTLFLLHWYIGKKEQVDISVLRNFSYRIRDTSKEFCEAIIKTDIDFDKESISDQIKDSARYHDAYDFDPTVRSMLVVLNEIHEHFKGNNELLWDRLKNIRFWCLSLEKFGLTDDLFVKMNARGKRLTRFDVFKSDLESKIEKARSIQKSDISDEWKKEIDNNYLDLYWKRFGVDYAERNLFRTILFYIKGLISAKNTAADYDDSWETNEDNAGYYDVIEYIEREPSALKCLCSLLGTFDNWYDRVEDKHLFVTTPDSSNIVGYNKVMVFGVLYWYSVGLSTKHDDFEQFFRILTNYVYSLRQPNITPAKRFYSSSIDNSNVGKSFSFVKKMLDGYLKGDRTGCFNDYVLSSSDEELKYEREKLESPSLPEIMTVEKMSYFKSNIYNLFYEGKLFLDKKEMEKIFSDDDLINIALRIIYSFADEKYGRFQELLMDKTLIKSGHKQLYYNYPEDQATGYFHKFIFNDSEEFGDRILTANGTDIYSDISSCVRNFVKAMSDKIHNERYSLENALYKLLDERMSLKDYSDDDCVKWYIVCYDEFFYDKRGTTLSVLRRKYYGRLDDDNIYDMQCIADNNDFGIPHYNPFYLALCHKLNNQITIQEDSLKYTGVHIEYKHPCILSNGWMIRMDDKGNWNVDFQGRKPDYDIDGMQINAEGIGIVDCSGRDSIKMMAEVLNAL